MAGGRPGDLASFSGAVGNASANYTPDVITLANMRGGETVPLRTNQGTKKKGKNESVKGRRNNIPWAENVPQAIQTHRLRAHRSIGVPSLPSKTTPRRTTAHRRHASDSPRGSSKMMRGHSQQHVGANAGWPHQRRRGLSRLYCLRNEWVSAADTRTL